MILLYCVPNLLLLNLCLPSNNLTRDTNSSTGFSGDYQNVSTLSRNGYMKKANLNLSSSYTGFFQAPNSKFPIGDTMINMRLPLPSKQSETLQGSNPSDSNKSIAVLSGGRQLGVITLTRTSSCRGRCGLHFTPPKCSCDGLCVVYGTCCSSFQQDCHEMALDAERLWGNVGVICDFDLGVFIVNTCPDRPHVSVPRHLLVNDIRSQFPVTELTSGIVFTNYTVYVCNARDGDLLRFWTLVVRKNGNYVHFDTTNDVIMYAMRSVNVFAYSLDLPGARCIASDSQFNSDSSVHIDIGPLLNMTVTKKLTITRDWIKITCGSAVADECFQVKCVGTQEIINRKCAFIAYITVSVSHPPKYNLSYEQIYRLAKIMELELEENVLISNVKILKVAEYEVDTVKYFPDFNKKLLPFSFFTLKFFCKVFDNISLLWKQPLLNSLNSFMSESDLISAESFNWLKYISTDEKIDTPCFLPNIDFVTNITSDLDPYCVLWCLDFSWEPITNHTACAALASTIGLQEIRSPNSARHSDLNDAGNMGIIYQLSSIITNSNDQDPLLVIHTFNKQQVANM